jgi:acyl dehydratase
MWNILKQCECNVLTADKNRAASKRLLNYDSRFVHHHQHQQQQQRPMMLIQGTIPSSSGCDEIDLRVGQYAELHRKYTQDDLNAFGAISGDYNPVHFRSNVGTIKSRNTLKSDWHLQQYNVDDEQQNPPPRSIVHGILLASVFSTIFGTLLPGCVYRSQSFKFHYPVFVDEEIYGRVVVTRLRHINDDGGIVGRTGVLCKCDTTIYKKVAPSVTRHTCDYAKDTVLCTSGDAQVYWQK